jgi:hypothetical protein
MGGLLDAHACKEAALGDAAVTGLTVSRRSI